MLTASVGTLSSATAVPTSLVTYASTTYTFTIVPGNAIPVGGIIIITLPSEITIPNPTLSGNSCSARRNLNNQNSTENLRNLAATGLENSFTCACTSSTIQVNNGFELSAFAAGGTISFDIQGIRNPVSLEPSSSFTMVTQTSTSYSIERLNSGITVTMTSTTSLQQVTISSTSLVNGASNNPTFAVNSPSDLSNGQKLTIVFPSQVALSSTVTCVGVTNLASSLTCSKSSQTVEVTLSFTTGSTLSAGNTFSLSIQSITNPSSTKPTDNFGVSVRNTNSKFKVYNQIYRFRN